MNSSAAACASKYRCRHRSTFSAGSSGSGSLVIAGVQFGEDLLGHPQPVVGDRPAPVVSQLDDDLDNLLARHPQVQCGPDVTAQLPVGARQRDRGQRDQFPFLDAQVRAGPDLTEQMVDGDVQEVRVVARPRLAAEDLLEHGLTLLVPIHRSLPRDGRILGNVHDAAKAPASSTAPLPNAAAILTRSAMSPTTTGPTTAPMSVHIEKTATPLPARPATTSPIDAAGAALSSADPAAYRLSSTTSRA